MILAEEPSDSWPAGGQEAGVQELPMARHTACRTVANCAAINAWLRRWHRCRRAKNMGATMANLVTDAR